jgi:hypothetical protein
MLFLRNEKSKNVCACVCLGGMDQDMYLLHAVVSKGMNYICHAITQSCPGEHHGYLRVVED